MSLRIAIIHAGFETVTEQMLNNIATQLSENTPIIEHTRSIHRAYTMTAEGFDIYILAPFWDDKDHGPLLKGDIMQHTANAIIFSLTSNGVRQGWEDQTLTYTELRTDRVGELIKQEFAQRSRGSVEKKS